MRPRSIRELKERIDKLQPELVEVMDMLPTFVNLMRDLSLGDLIEGIELSTEPDGLPYAVIALSMLKEAVIRSDDTVVPFDTEDA